MLSKARWTIRFGLIGTAVALAVFVTTTTARAYQTAFSDLKPLYALQAPTASCASSEREARMTRPEFPEYPAIAVGQGIDGQALIVFTLASDGNLKGASIAQTSGNQWLDQAALYAVKKSRYEAAVHDCSRVGGTYGVEVGFSTQSLMPVNGFAGAGGRHPIK